MRRHILNRWYCRLGGRHWADWWQSYIAFFRDIVELQLTGETWDRSRAYEDGQSAGWWWPFRDFVMVCDVPTTLHVEQVRPTGWGSHRLHCADGPAVAWADGWGVHSWHGTRVPGWVVDGTATVDMIMREQNTEVRRCAVEAFGWPRFIEDAELSMVGDPVPDPGNPGHTLSLFDIPQQLFAERVRILLCTNATAERDGTRHRFGLSVPAQISDPISAAAWSFGVDPTFYRTLERAS